MEPDRGLQLSYLRFEKGDGLLLPTHQRSSFLVPEQRRYPYKEEVQKHLLESITYAEVKGKIECMASTNATNAGVRQQTFERWRGQLPYG